MGCCINCRNNCAWSLTRERAERLRSLKIFIAFQENLMGNSHFNGSWSTFRFSFFFSCTHDNPRRWVWVSRGGVYAIPPCACCCCCCAQLPGARPDELTSRGAAIKSHRQAPHINALNFGRVAAAAGNNNYSKWHMCMWHTHTQSHTRTLAFIHTPKRCRHRSMATTKANDDNVDVIRRWRWRWRWRWRCLTECENYKKQQQQRQSKSDKKTNKNNNNNSNGTAATPFDIFVATLL